MTLKNTSWFDQAICRGHTNLFFEPFRETQREKRDREARARVVCGQCPVQQQCRQYARENEEHGIWGGETDYERYVAGYFNDPVMRRRMADRERRKRPDVHEKYVQYKRDKRKRDKKKAAASQDQPAKSARS